MRLFRDTCSCRYAYDVFVDVLIVNGEESGTMNHFVIPNQLNSTYADRNQDNTQYS